MPVVTLVVAAGVAVSLTAQASGTSSSSSSTLGLGERVYRLHCAECHGLAGDGWGERRDTTYARPRSFLSARFKFSTTENGVPSDADLERTLRRGLPGSGMPNWGWLTDAELTAVAAYVRALGVDGLRRALDEQVAAGELTAEEAAATLTRRTVPGAPVAVPPEPVATAERHRRGEHLYAAACAPCHGADGNPAAGTLKTDFEGNRLLPTSFAKGVFKGGGDGTVLYIRVLKGIPGTAMPAFEGAYSEDELWDIVHYVQALAAADSAGLQPHPATSAVLAARPAGDEAGAAADGAPASPPWEDTPPATTVTTVLVLALGFAVAVAVVVAVGLALSRSRGQPGGP